MFKVEKTKDYAKFKNLAFNRDINKNKVLLLMGAMMKENCLSSHPIIVDEHFQIIDGQHRFEAAKRLDEDIFYIQNSNVSQKHVMVANLYQSRWTTLDVIKYYAVKEGKKDYQMIYALCNELKLKPKALFSLIFGHLGSKTASAVNNGTFALPKQQTILRNLDGCVFKFKRFVDFTKKRQIKPFLMFYSHKFCSAFRVLVLNKTFDEDQFFKNLENKWYTLKPQADSREWYMVLEKMFNWKIKGKERKISVDFSKELEILEKRG